MALTVGARLGVYEVTAPIGEGGMGQVWQATDTTLGRSVAIKILPDAFASDPERLARFEREAKTLGALNHPHIASIYGFERSSGTHALVMEFVEGEDLAQRLKQGALPVDEALPIARQIAEALEAAHEQGIIHRDLKPANIKVTPDGAVKVLDFGLAKAIDPAPGGGTQANSPTITTPAMTMRGVILGTAVYMAPEQARGRAVDRRADIWAFGCVVYEMLAGVRPFDGEDTTEILGAIVKTEPDWSHLPSSTPPRISALVRRCLQKDPKKRLQHIGDARIEIDEAIAAPAETRKTAPAAWLPWTVAAVMALVAAIALVALPRGTTPSSVAPNRVVQYDIPMASARHQATLSPDGRYLAYLQLGAEGRAELMLRDLGKPTADRLGELTGGGLPIWAPDSLSVSIVEAPSTFRRFDIRTRSSVGQPLSAAAAAMSFGFGGVAMLADHRVVVGAGPASPHTTLHLWTPEAVAELLPLDTANNEVRQTSPARVDADRITFASLRADGSTHLCLTTIATPRSRCVGALNQNSRAFYHDGRLVFARGQSLLARGFDPDRAVFTSEEQVILDGLSPAAAARIIVTDAGALAFPAGDGGEMVVWQTATGQETVIANRAVSTTMALSPDGSRVLTTQNADQYLLDLKTGGSARLGTTSGDAIWAPDGRRFAHRTLAGIVVRSVDDARESVVMPGSAVAFPEDWSRDGRWIVVGMRAGPTQIELLPVNGGDRVAVLGRDKGLSNADEMHFSPDGKWLAFNALSGTRQEVFVVPLPPTGQRWQVSSAGGAQARWHPSGRTLYFLNLAGMMMSVDIAGGAAFSAGVPKALFDAGFTPSPIADDYRVAPDGRFLLKKPLAQGSVRIILNWPALLAPQNTP